MSSTAIELHHHDRAVEHHHALIDYGPEHRQRMNRLGMWLFIISESFLFSGILVARTVLLRDDQGVTRPDLDQALGLVITSILLLSSFFVNLGEVSISKGNRQGFLLGIGGAIVMGFVFVGGVAYEWSIAHNPVDGNIEGGMFFFMTGMHALHVITGLVFLLVVFWNGWLGNYTKESHWGVEASALYWHFVDVVWVFFYVALYLVGHVPHNG